MGDDPLKAGYYVVLIMKLSSKLYLVDNLTKHAEIYRHTLCYNVTLSSPWHIIVFTKTLVIGAALWNGKHAIRSISAGKYSVNLLKDINLVGSWEKSWKWSFDVLYRKLRFIANISFDQLLIRLNDYAKNFWPIAQFVSRRQLTIQTKLFDNIWESKRVKIYQFIHNFFMSVG